MKRFATKSNKMRNKSRSNSGATILEEAAALAISLPFVFLSLLGTIEVHSFMLVKNCLDEGARVGARGCAMAYHWPTFGSGQIPVGTLYSPDAQGDTIDPATTSGSTPATSPTVNGTDNAIASTSPQPRSPNEAFARVRINSIITKNSQFSAVYVPASVNDISAPQYQSGRVTVTVSAKLSQMPFIDPLHLKSIINPTISASAAYSL